MRGAKARSRANASALPSTARSSSEETAGTGSARSRVTERRRANSSGEEGRASSKAPPPPSGSLRYSASAAMARTSGSCSMRNAVRRSARFFFSARWAIAAYAAMRVRCSVGGSSTGARPASTSRFPPSGAPTEAISPPRRSMLDTTGLERPVQSFTRMEKANRSPPTLWTNPDRAVTRSRVPVLARSRPAASVPSMRRRSVPSRAAMPRDETNSAATGKRFQIAVSKVTIWCAEKRLVSLRPLPFFSWYEPRGRPSSASRSWVTSIPFAQVPGAPRSSAPRVLRSISAMKFEDTLFMSRTMSASSSES